MDALRGSAWELGQNVTEGMQRRSSPLWLLYLVAPHSHDSCPLNQRREEGAGVHGVHSSLLGSILAWREGLG